MRVEELQMMVQLQLKTNLQVAITPGKAYVQGYELEKTALTFKDLKKARDFDTINAGVTNLEIGNFTRITNVYGTPDIGDVSGETTPYKQIKLFELPTSTRGATSMGRNMGVARPKAFEFLQGVIGSVQAEHKIFLFDIQMFTRIHKCNTKSNTHCNTLNWCTSKRCNI